MIFQMTKLIRLLTYRPEIWLEPWLGNLTWNFVNLLIDKQFFTYFSFFKLKMENFGRQNLIILFSNFQNFHKIQNPRRQFITHSIYNQLALSLKMFSRQFPRTLIFNRNRQNMMSLWRHLEPTYPDLENFKVRLRYVKKIEERVFKVSWRYLLWFLSHRTTSGGGKFPQRDRVNNRTHYFEGHAWSTVTQRVPLIVFDF